MNILYKTGYVILYGALAFGVLETAARVDDWINFGAPLLKPYTINTIFRASETGREGVPGARFSKWHMNHLGYRGPEPAENRKNVLTFGASETFGLYESANHEYPRLLEAALNQGEVGSAKFNVINAALPGMRIGRVAYLTEALQKTQAAYLVLYPSPANYIGTLEPYCKVKAMPSPPESGLGDTLRIAGKFEQFTKKVMPAWLSTALREFAIGRASRNLQVIDVVPEQTIDALVGDLNCAVDTALSRKAVPVLVTHATYFGDKVEPQARGMMVAWRRFYPDLSEAGFMNLEARANEAIRKLARQRGIALVDAARQIGPGPGNFADFVHFTDAGALAMSRDLALTIEALEARSATVAPLQ